LRREVKQGVEREGKGQEMGKVEERGEEGGREGIRVEGRKRDCPAVIYGWCMSVGVQAGRRRGRCASERR